MNPLLRWNCVVYQTLLALYPPEVRGRFGEEMADTFTRQLVDAWAEERTTGILRVWAIVLPEFFLIAAPGQLLRPALMLPAAAVLVSGPLYLSLIWALQHPLVLNAWYHQVFGGGRR